MTNRARKIFCQGKFPAALNICTDCDPIVRCFFDFYAASLSSYFSQPLALKPLAG